MTPSSIWLDAAADGVIAAAYLSIPITLTIYFLRRRDSTYPSVWILFAGFFVLGALTHLLAAMAPWLALPAMTMTAKITTAVVSAATAAVMWVMMPRVLSFPSRNRLQALNAELEEQISRRALADQRLRLLVDAVPDYAILMLDPAGCVTSWNSGGERIKGYREQEILGEHFSRFYTEEDRAAGKPQQGLEIARIEGRFEDQGWRVRRNGSLFWAEVVITAIRDATGEILGYGNVTHDATEQERIRKALEDANADLGEHVRERSASLAAMSEQLAAEIAERNVAESTRREAAELLQATFDTAPFPIIITGTNGEVLMWNKAGEITFGYSEVDLKARGFGMLAPSDSKGDAAKIYDAGRKGAVNTLARAVRADGEILDIRLSAAPILREDGSIRAIVGMMEDLTQVNKTEAQLRQSQKMEAIGTLTGGHGA